MSTVVEKIAALPPEKRRLLEARLQKKGIALGKHQITPRRQPRDVYPPSFGQQRLWFLHQLEPESSAYNLPANFYLRGALDRAALRRAVDAVGRRHESLRTTFSTVDGEPLQVVHPRPPFVLPWVDLSGLPAAARERQTARLAAQHVRRPFDLARGPLWRCIVLRRAGGEAEEHAFLLTLHHTISDAWSEGILFRELLTCYEAFRRGAAAPLAKLPIQYVDFALWQQEWLRGDTYAAQLEYWRRQLEAVPPVLELPLDRPRPPLQTYRGGEVVVPLGAVLSRKVRRASRAWAATSFVTFLTAFKVLLYRITGQTDLVVGTPIAGRNRQEIEGLVGFFVNTLVLRTGLGPEQSFREAVERVRQVNGEANANQDLPFERLVDELQPQRNPQLNPLFQVSMVFQTSPAEEAAGVGSSLEVAPMETANPAAVFDLMLSVVETGEHFFGHLSYNSDLFDRTTALRLGRQYARLLEAAVAEPEGSAPERPIAELPLMSPAERQALLAEWNDTGAVAPPLPCLHQLFEQQVARTPEAAALTAGSETLGYRELEARANRLAWRLRRLGVGAEARVGICLERTPEMVVALLAVLKAGGAYVSLDPAYPQQRLAWMVEDAGMGLVLTTEELRPRLPEHGAHVLCLDSAAAQLAAESAAAPRPVSTAENLAYVLYTSGSTGRPKGVAIGHRSAVAMVCWARGVYSAEELSGTLASTSINFDLSVYELFVTLASGGRLVLVDNALELISQPPPVPVSLINTVPSAMRELLRAEAVPPSVRTINLAGEALLRPLVEEIHQHTGACRLVNLYGPSEDTTYSTMAQLPPGSGAVPIGRPLAGGRAYVLDRHMRPAALGAMGELYLAGVGLARGYLARPGLSAARFVPDPWSAEPGGRLYRTGDLVRLRGDGELLFLGRADHQVKVRGFRIELGEIEAALAARPEVAEAAVLVRQDAAAADSRLIAYVVLAQAAEDEAAVAELRRALGEELPPHMVPASFVMLDALPLTPNGKLDRAALGRKALPAAQGVAYVAPRGAVEELIAGVWSEILDTPRISAHDNFFEIGGHSLMAGRVLSRLERAFGAQVPVREMFQRPTVAAMAAWVSAAQTAGGTVAPPIAPVPREAPLPLSFAQERLWFLDRLQPGSTAYNIPAVMRLAGTLSVPALERTLEAIVRRHEALRTTFGEAGEPVQVIASAAPLPLPLVDLSDLAEAPREAEVRRLAGREIGRPFDLARGPLLRTTLLRCAAEEHVLFLNMHHIVSDGWSLGVLVRELVALYGGFIDPGGGTGEAALPELPVQYADFAVWQRAWLEGEELERQQAYWRDQLAGAPAALALPTDRPRPAVQTFSGANRGRRLAAGGAAELSALGRRESTTLFMTLLAAFAVLLGRTTGQRDIVVGSPIAGRVRPELEDLIGFFVNTLALRLDTSPRASFRDLLGAARRVTLDAYAHQDLPFERLVEELKVERDLSRSPLFQVMLVLQNAPAGTLEVPGLTLSPLDLEVPTSKLELTLNAVEGAGELWLTAEYNTDLFDATTIERLLGHYERLLAALAAAPERPLSEPSLWSAAERHMLLAEHGDTGAVVPPAPCLHQLCERQAARTPAAPALTAGSETLSYGELEVRANRLAWRLRRLGVGAEARVGICLERTPEMVVALLAVLKAGGAYVSLDPAYPQQRLGWMVEDAAMGLVLTTEELRPRLPEGGAEVLCLDSAAAELAAESDAAPRLVSTADNLAYVLYTSGSTGRPKGVAIRHRSAVAMVCWARGVYGAEELSGMLASTSINFDLSVYELFVTLASGGRLVLVDNALELISRPPAVPVSLINTVPSAMRELLRAGAVPASVRTINLAGEALLRPLVEEIHARGGAQRLVNLYGPSEDTTYSTMAQLPPGGVGAVPIGRALAGGRACVLGAGMVPAPFGAVGELYLAGDGLARGYLARPGLTAERFVPDPWSAEAGGRLYRTGDLVRLRGDGELLFLGRADHQVKVRGFRIELGEIEVALEEHPEVAEAAVLALEERPGEARIVAYVVPPEMPGPSTSQLRAHLAPRLPAAMVPAVFVSLEALPLTPNGKLDRAALPAPEGERPELADAYAAPRTEIEQVIAGVWRELLGLDRVGLSDNFFELGGHSMLMVRLRERLRETLERDVAVVDLFRFPTVATLAEFLRPGQARPEAAPERRRRRRAEPGSGVAIVGLAGRFPAAPDVDALWRNLRAGVEAVTFLSDEELERQGVAAELLAHPSYVKACSFLPDADLFDAGLFGYSPREAEIIDPQQRLFLECAWEALESAGCDPETYGGAIGVYAGSGANYYVFNLMANAATVGGLGMLPVLAGNDKDFLATRVAYKLGLRGPAVNVQTACSTSLVAAHLACRGLLDGECDMALAGGVSISSHQPVGYLYQEEGILSPDGHCRAFDARAQGTLSGNGAGIVVLKRLDDALADGDLVHAVIRGSAINNDGSVKVGFTAPSVDGQAEVIREAYAAAAVAPQTVGYVECHGTATPLGDPIEMAALGEAFGSCEAGRCAVGSVKTNLGHLDAAAGVTGLIKATLALAHREIPPSLHYEAPNPAIDFANSPFHVAAELAAWPRPEEHPRRAGVSSFGLGGTNAHLVLEEAPEAPPSGPSRPWQLLVLSAASEASLAGSVERLAAALGDGSADGGSRLADAAHTLQVGRRRLPHRCFAVCRDAAAAAAVLAEGTPERLLGAVAEASDRPVVFLLPGVGDHYPGMAVELYRAEPTFRDTFDRCAELLAPHLGADLRRLLLADADPDGGAATAGGEVDLKRLLGRGGERSAAAQRLDRTAVAQPLVFAVEVALAGLWHEWGIEPEALIGYSLGEYTAAHLAGVLSLSDAARLVALRALLIEELPGGAMLAVPMSEAELAPRLVEGLALAATNTTAVCVVSGPQAAIAELERRLAEDDIAAQRLRTSHAFHSPMMEPIAERFREVLAGVELRPPRIPYLSNVTGGWITPEEATDPETWVRHLCGTVRFAEGLETLLGSPGEHVLLEVGPGQALATAARQHAAVGARHAVATSLRDARDRQSDVAFVLAALGRLWVAGARVDWRGFARHEQRRRVALPTYAFDRRRYWLEASPQEGSAAPAAGSPAAGAPAAGAPAAGGDRKSDVADFFYAPCWKLSDAVAAAGDAAPSGPYLLFASGADGGLGERLAARLGEAGEAVVRAVPGEAFARLEDSLFALPAGQRQAYGELCEALAADRNLPATVVHLWGVGDDIEPPVAPPVSERLLDECFYSLLFASQALAEAGCETLRLLIVTSGAQAVTGVERLVAERAASQGPARVLPQELEGLSCRCVDVPRPRAAGEAEALADRLLEELAAEEPELAVAYRRGQRWVQGYEPLALAPHPRAAARLRREGVYLITGGLGGMGLVFAHDLARRTAARLVLVSRTPLPERRRWPEILAAAGSAEDRVGRRIREVQALEEAGAEVMLASADVADPQAMAAVVAAARERFGAIHGVVHTAGVAGVGLGLLKDRAAAAAVLRPKVIGSRVLEALFAGCELDFLILTSSLSAILGGFGQIDYCAGNAVLDAFAHARAVDGGGPTLSINYDVWREVGLALDVEVLPQYAQEHRENLRLGLTSAEGVEALHRLLDRGMTQVAVTPLDLRSMVAGSLALHRARALRAMAERGGASLHARPALATAYEPPSGETQSGLVEIWQNLLGVEEVGIHDSFFELGGDSLVGIQMISRIRRRFDAGLTLEELFEAPTVARLGEKIDSDDDGLSMLEELLDEIEEAEV